MLKEYLANIANAIRSKLGTADKVNAQDFAYKVNEVYDKGRADENSDWWDIVQQHGNRSDYVRAFAYTNHTHISPKYKIDGGGNGGDIFCSALFKGAFRLKTIDGEKFDLSNYYVSPIGTSSSTYTLCEYCNSLEHFPDLKLRAGNWSYTFSDNFKLHTIDILRSTEECLFNGTFRNNKVLKNITFDGIVGRNIDFSWSPLSVESMKNLITHLADYSETNTGIYKVTLTSACWESLEESGKPFDDGLTDDETLSWKEYVNNMGWNT